MSRIDSHIHIFENGWSDDRTPGEEFADYEALRGEYGIDRALVVGFEGDPAFDGNTDYILRLATEHEWVVPLAYLDVVTARPHFVDSCVEAGAAGFSIYLGADSVAVHRVHSSVWDAIDRHGSVLSVNAMPAALESLRSILDDIPNATVLISHLGLPGTPSPDAPHGMDSSADRTGRISALTELKRYPQVFVKLSGLYAIDPGFPHAGAEPDFLAALDAFGAGRLVWGSDFSPGLDVVKTEELFVIPEWVSKQLSSDELEDLEGGTLRRILGAV